MIRPMILYFARLNWNAAHVLSWVIFPTFVVLREWHDIVGKGKWSRPMLQIRRPKSLGKIIKLIGLGKKSRSKYFLVGSPVTWGKKSGESSKQLVRLAIYQVVKTPRIGGAEHQVEVGKHVWYCICGLNWAYWAGLLQSVSFLPIHSRQNSDNFWYSSLGCHICWTGCMSKLLDRADFEAFSSAANRVWKRG